MDDPLSLENVSLNLFRRPYESLNMLEQLHIMGTRQRLVHSQSMLRVSPKKKVVFDPFVPVSPRAAGLPGVPPRAAGHFIVCAPPSGDRSGVPSSSPGEDVAGGESAARAMQEAEQLASTTWLNGQYKLLQVGPRQREVMTAAECCEWFRVKRLYEHVTGADKPVGDLLPDGKLIFVHDLLFQKHNLMPPLLAGADGDSVGTPPTLVSASEDSSQHLDNGGHLTVSLQSAQLSAETMTSRRWARVKRTLFPRDALIVRSELEVRSSHQDSTAFAAAGRLPGLGVFAPRDRGGWTANLAFGPDGVMRVPTRHVLPWQQQYKVMDRNAPGMWFVPKTEKCRCVLFRAQHCSVGPTHFLLQIPGQKFPSLLPLRPLTKGEEITFDYGDGYIERIEPETEEDDADSMVGDPNEAPTGSPPLGGHGWQKYHEFVDKLTLRASEYDRLDVRPDLGFSPCFADAELVD
jgi:hypothetical protein